MDRATVDVYQRRAGEWAEKRRPTYRERAVLLAGRCLPGLPVGDLGCGPGHYLGDLAGAGARPVVAVDAAGAMLSLAQQGVLALARDAPAMLVQADIEALPVRDRSLGGVWASNSYLHVPRTQLPLALARLHSAMEVGAPLTISGIAGVGEGPLPTDDFPGRRFTLWRPGELADLLAGAGFEVDRINIEGERVWADASRGRTLADTVGAGMRVLVCGLNPSVVAADAGFGFAGPSNRFWKTAVNAGLVTRPRDPRGCLLADRVGMTDLVKRATPNAGVLAPEEYRAGAERVRRLVGWLRPRLVLFVGLTGWRVAIDAKAVPGLQPMPFAGVPAYVMPSTSGLNAHSRPADLAAHMADALTVVPPA